MVAEWGGGNQQESSDLQLYIVYYMSCYKIITYLFSTLLIFISFYLFYCWTQLPQPPLLNFLFKGKDFVFVVFK